MKGRLHPNIFKHSMNFNLFINLLLFGELLNIIRKIINKNDLYKNPLKKEKRKEPSYSIKNGTLWIPHVCHFTTSTSQLMTWV